MRGKGRSYRVGLVGLAVAICLGDLARAAESRPKEMRQVLEQQGQQRDFIPLGDAEIEKALIGQRLAPDRAVDWYPNKTSLGFAEDFLADGSWSINKAIRSVIVEHGVWRIHDGQICTRVTKSPFAVNTRPELCRQVWRDKSSGKIAMLEDSSRQVVLIFSSSALK